MTLDELTLSTAINEAGEYMDVRIRKEFAERLLALLKKQEAVKPRYEDYFGNRIARCGNCNGYIVRYKYCPGCGQAVKWE